MLWPVSELFWRLLFLTRLHAQLFQTARNQGVSQDSGLWVQKPEGSPRQTRMVGHSINQGPSILTVIQLAPSSIKEILEVETGPLSPGVLTMEPNRALLPVGSWGHGVCAHPHLLINLSLIKSFLYLPTMTLVCAHPFASAKEVSFWDSASN